MQACSPPGKAAVGGVLAPECPAFRHGHVRRTSSGSPPSFPPRAAPLTGAGPPHRGAARTTGAVHPAPPGPPSPSMRTHLRMDSTGARGRGLRTHDPPERVALSRTGVSRIADEMAQPRSMPPHGHSGVPCPDPQACPAECVSPYDRPRTHRTGGPRGSKINRHPAPRPRRPPGGQTREQAPPEVRYSSRARSAGETTPERSSTGTWRSLVAHLTGGQGVAGSNPVVPTVHEARWRSISLQLSGLLRVCGSSQRTTRRCRFGRSCGTTLGPGSIWGVVWVSILAPLRCADRAAPARSIERRSGCR